MSTETPWAYNFKYLSKDLMEGKKDLGGKMLKTVTGE